MSRRTSRKYGLPFNGYVGSLQNHVCPPDSAASGSYNMMFVPADGSFVRRSGSTIQGDTTTNVGTNPVVPTEVAGLLEGKWGAKDRLLAEMESLSIADGLPTYSVLYTKETMTTGYLDDGRFGQLYFRDGSTNQVCGKSFGATHYPASGLANFQCVPLWYDSGDGGLTRLNTKLARRFHCPGSRRFLDVGGWRYFPSYSGTPSRWNRRFNAASGPSSTENEQHFPSGPVPPLWSPTIAWDAATSTVGPWASGQRFYASVMFQFEDGSWSMPTVPRSINATLAAGLGLTTVSGTTGQYSAFGTWTFPIGPPGTVRRALLRSDSTNIFDTGAIDPSADKLKITAVIEDNTSTTYIDYKGDDAALLEDTNNLYFRWDHIMPPPSRYIWEFDGRVAHGYGRTSRCAIFLGPTGITAAKDLNLPIDSASWGTAQFFIHNDGTTLRLKYLYGGTTTENEYTLASYATIQALVDAINATTTASAGKEWRAQIAPGASVMASPADLMTHSRTVATCSGTSGNTYIDSAASFSAIAVGMRVKPDTDSHIPAATYVKAVKTATRLYLCDADGADVALTGDVSSQTLTFYMDVGDTEPAAVGGHTATIGSQRVVGGSYYACLYFKNSHFSKEPSGKNAVWMTVGGPLQVRNSANAFVAAASNKHMPPGNSGICMGGGGLADGCVVLFANERHVLRNTKGGRTGLDEDYRLDRATRTGCIADGGVVVGFNWVGYPSWEGFIACDVGNEINLTRALWDAGAKRGEFEDEFNLCINGASKDSDLGHFHAAVVGNRLHLTYRADTADATPSRRVVMDFGEGSQASGLGQLLDPGGKPWGWSAPLYERVSSIGSVRKTTGFSLYGAICSNSGTADGRVDLIETGYQDNGVAVACALYCAKDFFDSLRHKAANDSILKFAGTSAAADITATLYGTSAAAAYSAVALVPGTGQYTRKAAQWGQTVRGSNENFYLVYADAGASATPSTFWGAETSVDVLETYT